MWSRSVTLVNLLLAVQRRPCCRPRLAHQPTVTARRRISRAEAAASHRLRPRRPCRLQGREESATSERRTARERLLDDAAGAPESPSRCAAPARSARCS
jgi:hypothetical protein